FFDFEAARGFADGSFQMGNKERPKQITSWLTSGRKWRLPPTLGCELGTPETEDAWVGIWWGWWRHLQPGNRIWAFGKLTRPETADWSKLAGMYGRNGLLQVMATLYWWGERVEDRLDGATVLRARDTEGTVHWKAAVEDVTWVLEQIIESGEMET
ncbi:hypothetical protein DFH06DRAFT_1023442, partial [Mycena polygramma]